MTDERPPICAVCGVTMVPAALSAREPHAVDHLRHAIDMSEQFRAYAKGDSDFDPIRDEPAFKELIGS